MGRGRVDVLLALLRLLLVDDCGGDGDGDDDDIMLSIGDCGRLSLAPCSIIFSSLATSPVVYKVLSLSLLAPSLL